MRSFIILLFTLCISLSADVIDVKKGWQLIGTATNLNIEKSFNHDDVEIVWGFDALTQSWSGYSTDAQKFEKISTDYTQLITLKPFQALWVFSKNDWKLSYKPQKSLNTPTHRSITLEKGWNLISIPQQIVVSDKFFGESTVWRYSKTKEWSVNNNNLNFPSIETIKQSEGLWVKSDEIKTIDIDKQSSELHSFDSRQSMLTYIQSMLDMNQYYHRFGIEMTVSDSMESTKDMATATNTTVTDATTTNLQESGVDEGDILKHDGTHVFHADNKNSKIIISSFKNLTTQIYDPINTISFKDKNIITIYLQNSHLIVISHQNYNYQGEMMIKSMAPQYSNTLTLDIFDINDVLNIKNISTHVLDGRYKDSRLIDSKLYLISQFAPSKNLLPTITTNAQSSKELVSHDHFYAPLKLNQRAGITSLSSFDMSDGTFIANSSFLGNTHTFYASLKALYLVSNEYPLYYDYKHYKEQQMIYKFLFDDTLSYAGNGFVDGRMLNQFSMGEKDDYLRVATTSGWSWWSDAETTNSVYILKQVDNKLELEGSLSGLGHEGETIRAVRFMGERGFVVTFKQTDPLYTLDLSNPKEPKVVGELSIPGFSSYLHVVDENRVLSIGHDADENGRQLALQFQLFDISDFSKPQLADKLQIGDKYSYSQAERDHKAFSYRSSDLMFGVPFTNRSNNYNNRSENFGIYQIDGLKITNIDTITSSDSSWGDVARGVIFDMNSSTYGVLFKGSNIISKTIK